MNNDTRYYTVPEQYAGKTIEQITNPLGYGSGSGLLSILGIGASQPLTAGQTFAVNAPAGHTWEGSGELQTIGKLFQPGQSPAQQQTTQASDTLNQAKTEAVGTLEQGKLPLKERYSQIIDSIKGTAGQRRSEVGEATASSFGKRGIPLTSGLYSQELQKGYAPVDVAEASSLSQTALQEQQGLNEIDKAIATIQMQTGRDQVQTALEYFKIQENARLQGISLEESARQFNENLAFQKEQASQTTTDPYSQYTSIGEGSTLYDLLNQQAIYTAPKTYKQTGSSNDNDPY